MNEYISLFGQPAAKLFNPATQPATTFFSEFPTIHPLLFLTFLLFLSK